MCGNCLGGEERVAFCGYDVSVSRSTVLLF